MGLRLPYANLAPIGNPGGRRAGCVYRRHEHPRRVFRAEFSGTNCSPGHAFQGHRACRRRPVSVAAEDWRLCTDEALEGEAWANCPAGAGANRFAGVVRAVASGPDPASRPTTNADRRLFRRAQLDPHVSPYFLPDRELISALSPPPGAALRSISSCRRSTIFSLSTAR